MHNSRQASERAPSHLDKNLTGWQLTLLGVGFTTGTGYFLASALAIRMAGWWVLLTFSLAAIASYFVLEALSLLVSENPQQGSFRTYAKLAFGPWAGFGNGWLYWTSECLVLGSTLTALGLFTQYWLPHMPLWELTGAYACLGVLIVAWGTRAFERTENVLALVKIAAIVGFLVVVSVAAARLWQQRGDASGVFHIVSKLVASSAPFDIVQKKAQALPVRDVWTSFIFAFYAFGGIEVMGLMAVQLKQPKSAPKSGLAMMITVTTLYLASMMLILGSVDYRHISVSQSPFLSTLQFYRLSVLAHLFNGIFIVAAFSVLVASIYAVTSMVVTLSKDGDAPAWIQLGQQNAQQGRLPWPALALTASFLILSVLLSLLLPKQLYEHIATAAGLLLMYTWMFIVAAFWKLYKANWAQRIKSSLAVMLIFVAVLGTSLHPTTRPGFFISLLLLGGIAALSILIKSPQFRWARRKLRHK